MRISQSFALRIYKRLKSCFRLLFILILLLNYTQSFGQKSIRFNVEGPELLTTNSLKEFMGRTDAPKIVVRYSSFPYDDSSFDLNYLYNVIEKEFIKGGYSVKDRILFEEVVNRAEDMIDYGIIQEKTDTELIFEIVKLDTDLDYVTDSYFNKKGLKKVLYKDGEVRVKGAMAEFKLIIVEKNEFAGSYTFHYVPCESGCPVRLNDYDIVFEDDFGDKLPSDVYSEVTQEQLEEFLGKASKQLINHLNQVKGSISDNE